MNVPPSSGIRVPPEDLRLLVAALFAKSGTSVRHAQRLAQLLVWTDLRGVFSHGTRQAPGYARMMLQGRLNPRPAVRVVKETATTQVLDGDGGLGHLPCYQGMSWAIARAREHGTAAVTTGNHFHFGGGSKYSCLALEQDCIGVAVSSHRFALDPEQPVLRASGGSPISIAVPAGRQPPLVLDMGAHFVPFTPELFQQYPGSFFKGLGLAAVLQALGGILAGIYKPEFQAPKSPWESNQGAFLAAFDVSCFMPVDDFKEEMDRYIGQARAMKPLPGFEQAEMAGGLEWHRQQDYSVNGIPVSPEHQQSLEALASELEIETPFTRYASTRFGS
jgi:LDH2 family malate/lactate/ureidoglycolate dehydrogenase